MPIIYNRIGETNPDSGMFEFKNPPEAAAQYIESLISYDTNNRTYREYKFLENSKVAEYVEAYASLNPVQIKDKNITDPLAKQVAEILIDEETKAAEHLSRTLHTEIKTGNLLLAMVDNEDGSLFFVFAKVEHINFFERDSLDEQAGFAGDEKDGWKTAVVEIKKTPQIIIDKVRVYRRREAKYWTDGFLGLEEVRGNEENSKRMYRAVREVLMKRVEKTSPNDYMLLVNALAQRMQIKRVIQYEEFINELLDSYIPQNRKIGSRFVNALKVSLLNLPKKKEFDSEFEVDPAAAQELIGKYTREVSNGVELTINEEIDKDELASLITARTIDGTRYLMIRCDNADTYNMFENYSKLN